MTTGDWTRTMISVLCIGVLGHFVAGDAGDKLPIRVLISLLLAVVVAPPIYWLARMFRKV